MDYADFANELEQELLSCSVKSKTKTPKKKKATSHETDFQILTQEEKEFTESPAKQKTKSPRKSKSVIDGTDFVVIKQEEREIEESPFKTKTKSQRKQKLATDGSDFNIVKEENGITESPAKKSQKRRLSIDIPDFEIIKEEEKDVTEDSFIRKTKKKKHIYEAEADKAVNGEKEITESPIVQKTKSPRKKKHRADEIGFKVRNDEENEIIEGTIKSKGKTQWEQSLILGKVDVEALEDGEMGIPENPVKSKAKTPRKEGIKAEPADVVAGENGESNVTESPYKVKAKPSRKKKLIANGADVEEFEDIEMGISESPVKAKAKTPRKKKIKDEAADGEALKEGEMGITGSPVKAKAKTPRKKKIKTDGADGKIGIADSPVKTKAKTPQKKKIKDEAADAEALEDGEMGITGSQVKAKAKTPRKKKMNTNGADVEAFEDGDMGFPKSPVKAKAKTPQKKKIKDEAADGEALKEGETGSAVGPVKRKTQTPRKKKIKTDGADVDALEDGDIGFPKSPVKAKAKTPQKKKIKDEAADGEALKEGETGSAGGPVKRKTQTPRKKKITNNDADIETIKDQETGITLDDGALKEGETGTAVGPIKAKRKTTTRKNRASTNGEDVETSKAGEKGTNASPIKRKITTPRKRRATINGDEFESAYQILDCEDISLDEYGKYQKYNKDKPWKMLLFPHHLTPAFNVTRKPKVSEMRDYPLLNVSAPHSVYVNAQHLNSVDICHRRTAALNMYMNRLKQIRGAYFSAKKNNKQVRKNEKNGIFNKALIEYARRRESNPDKYFARDYDFYYSGGNLCVNPLINNVLHANGNNMESLTLSVFNVQNNLPVIEEIAKVNFNDTDKDSSEIFEVKFDRSACNTFFMRRKFCVSMHQYKDDNFYTLKKFKSKKKVPFISFAQDKVNANHLAVSNLEHVLRVYDLETGHRLHSFQLLEKENIKPATNWNQITSLDGHVYIYAACRKFNLIDIRVPESEWQSNYSGFTDEDYCANFSSLALSEFPNLFYIGSSHKVHCVDIRRIEENIESKYGSVVNWTHQMSSCPLMIATNGYDDCEHIALQSPLSADLRICENIQSLKESNDFQSPNKNDTDPDSKYVYRSHCLPYMPKSLESVFHEARKYGRCLNPYTGIVDRVKACTTGLSFVGDSSNPYILTLTSNGDLFARHMFDSADGDNKTGIECAAEVMTRYEENVNRLLNRPRLNVTEVSNFSGISKVFRCPALSEVEPIDNVDVKHKRRRLGRWQKSLQTLRKFQDALVPDLLSIWDIEEEDMKDVNLTSLSQKSASDSKHFVASWLNSTQQNANSTIVSINMDSFNLSCSALETKLDDTFENNVTQMESQQTIIISKPKISKKKKSYVKGF